MAEYITHEGARRLLSEYQDNANRLRGCKRHKFERDKANHDRFRCESCGGLVTDDQRRWYEQGVEHGQNGQPNKTRVQK